MGLRRDFPHAPTTSFLAECAHRERMDETSQSSSLGCRKISELAGHVLAVNPVFCARCRLNGDVNPAFIADQAGQLLTKMLGFSYLGFYKPDDVEEIFKRAYKHLRDNAKGREVVAAHLKGCVETGRLPLARAEALVKDHMPLLLETPQPKPPPGGYDGTIG